MFESFDDYDLDENLLRHRAAEFSAKVFLFVPSSLWRVLFWGLSFLHTRSYTDVEI